MSYDDEVRQEFLIESHETLDALDEWFIELEDDPGNLDVLSSIFRAMHTIKGTSGFLGFSRLGDLCHKCENLLSALRDGERGIDQPMTDALLAALDRIRQILTVIEDTTVDEGVPVEDLVERLVQLVDRSGDGSGAPVAAAATTSTQGLGQPVATEMAAGADDERATTPAAGAAGGSGGTGGSSGAADSGGTGGGVPPANQVEGDEPSDDDLEHHDPQHEDGPPPVRLGDILVAEYGVDRTDVEIAAAEQALGDSRSIGEILAERGVVDHGQLDDAVKKQTPSRRGAVESTIRVEVNLLDELMNLVGELVLTRNEIIQFVPEVCGTGLLASSQRLDQLITQLQEMVTRTRMQPIGGIWNKLPRVVRDIAAQCGKEVRLEMEGKGTELDKNLIEAIKDPLTHIVRNTIDHGIEDPQTRTERGKTPEGLLALSATHEDGQVIVTISDDGAGIDLDRVRAKALANQLVGQDTLDAMSDQETVQLIFEPGFSTAAVITSLSGRGVGLDVVRTNVEKIGGSVGVQSTPGQGTTFRLEIPLTLAIMPGLVISSAGCRYAIPERSLVELSSVGSAGHGHRVEFVHDAPVIRLRNRLLPVVDLRTVLADPPRDGLVGDVVVVSADDGEFSLLVDEILEAQEIVVKPLGPVVEDIRMFSGATILGDGEVALILDVAGVRAQAQVEVSRTMQPIGRAESEAPEPVLDQASMLLVSLGEQRTVAIGLPDVERLEDFAVGDIERSGIHQVVQSRSHVLPLIDLSSELGYGPGSGGDEFGRVSVVVHRHRGLEVGLIIGEMIDIVQHPVGGEMGGPLLIDGRVVEVLDLRNVSALSALTGDFHGTEMV